MNTDINKIYFDEEPLIELELLEKKVDNEFGKTVSKKDVFDEFQHDRYSDIIKHSKNSYHPKDFNYHDINSCGKQANLTKSNIYDSLRKNNIYCESDDYFEYNNKKIDNFGLDKITTSRKKACTCEYERKLTLDHYNKNEPEKADREHQIALKITSDLCKKCYKIEKEFKKEGQLKKNIKVKTNSNIEIKSEPNSKPNSEPKPEINDIVYYKDFEKLAKYMLMIQDDKVYSRYSGKDNVEKMINYLFKNIKEISTEMELSFHLQDNVDFDIFRKYLLANYYLVYKEKLQKDLNIKNKDKNDIIKYKNKIIEQIDTTKNINRLYQSYLEELYLKKLVYEKNMVKRKKSQLLKSKIENRLKKIKKL